MKNKLLTLAFGALALSAQPLYSQGKPAKNIVETAVEAGSFKTLAAALKAADLVGALQGRGPFTVFAPTDEAFAKLPSKTLKELLMPANKSKLQAILKYHVISGKIGLSEAIGASEAKTLQGSSVKVEFKKGRVRVNGAELLNADIATSNGVIHVIDSVLIPEEPKNTIAGVAKKAGKFNTLLAAVNAAGLNSVLSGEGKVTVLAPTDAAFSALPKGTVETLLKPENKKKLVNILSQHVIKGAVQAGTALNAKSARSVANQKLQFEIDNGIFKVNGAKVVTTDIKCDNGIIHVIDAVLIPSPTDSVKMTPSMEIERAISRGVPVFNHGNPGNCAMIYSACIQSLCQNASLSHEVRAMLAKVACEAEHISCSSSKAWALRKGLDKAYQMVTVEE